MADVTPSPATDGPFSLVTDESKKELEAKTHRPMNPLISQLLAEGKTPTQIWQAFADSAGFVPDV
jgi:hypothetical protein